jgi:phosphate transport system substrate-binding protein
MGKTMSYGIRKLSTRTKLVAAALALAMAGVSHAQTLVGGGATLPSIGYVGAAAATNLQVWGTSTSNTTEPNGTADYIDPNSLFGAYEAQSGNPNVSYCLTGSGAGKDILAGGSIGGTSYSVQNTCVKNSNGTVTGFGAGLNGVNRSDLSQPNFTGADSPMAYSDFQNYQASHGDSDYPMEFPAVAGAVAIAFNLTDDQGTPVTAANFSDEQLCNIFSGEDNNWSDADLSGAFTLPAGHTVNQPINVVYRSDGSGTTFSFANHLTYACSGTATAHFVANQAFTSVVAEYESTIPTGWIGASGNPAVATAIQNNEASIGYVETANALQTNPEIVIADVDGKSPTANFNSKLTVTASDVDYNSVINGANSTNGQAVVSTLSSLVSGSNTAPSTQCIALVNPAEYALPSTSTTTTMVPEGSYPIVAISYLLANAQGNSGDLTNTRGLLEAPYSSTIQSAATDIGGSTGLQFLTLAKGSFTSAQVGTCLAN